MNAALSCRHEAARTTPRPCRLLKFACAAWPLAAWQWAQADEAAQPKAADCISPACTRLPEALTDAIMIGMALLLFIGLLAVIKALRAQQWSLALALSEEATLPEGTPTPAAGQLPPMVGSSSRLIALIGTIILGTFFVGIGFYVVWQLCCGHDINTANSAWAFFASGSTLFLPYGINKITSMLS